MLMPVLCLLEFHKRNSTQRNLSVYKKLVYCSIIFFLSTMIDVISNFKANAMHFHADKLVLFKCY